MLKVRATVRSTGSQGPNGHGMLHLQCRLPGSITTGPLACAQAECRV